MTRITTKRKTTNSQTTSGNATNSKTTRGKAEGMARVFAVAGLLGVVTWGGMVTRAQDAPPAPHGKASKQPAIPLEGVWESDPMHTNINFAVRHMGVGLVHGRFDTFTGTVTADAKDISRSSVQFTIQAASIDTNQPQRDGHLKTADFFDVEKYPQITFQSSHITKKGGDAYVAHGAFTMHGVTKELDVPFELHGPIKDSFGAIRFGVQSHLQINRQDYGVKWNQTMDNGMLAVGNVVDIDINFEANPQEKKTASR